MIEGIIYMTLGFIALVSYDYIKSWYRRKKQRDMFTKFEE